MNILIHIAYIGTSYHGFQVQQNAVSVCQVLQNAMQAVLGARPHVKGCSRTDAGVHARDFCASFRYETDIPLEKLPLALNSQLPQDIRVLRARAVPEEFHARYSATGKQYEYEILNNAVDDPFRQGLYYRIPQPLNADAMHAAGQVLVGRHDFAAFQSAGSDVASTVRRVTELAVRREGERVLFTISADGFLYNMVRIIGGTLVLAGHGQLDAEGMRAILKGKDRKNAGPTLPARGLFLNRVFYPEAQLTDN